MFSRELQGLTLVTQVVSSARIHIHPTKVAAADNTFNVSRRPPPPLYAGQPIAATLTVGASFHWAGPGSGMVEGKRYSMRFDIKDTGKDWLISGRKKGDYEATVRACPFSTPIFYITLLNIHPRTVPYYPFLLH